MLSVVVIICASRRVMTSFIVFFFFCVVHPSVCPPMHQSEILVSVIFQEKSGWMFVGFVWCSHCTRQMYRFWNRSSQDEGHTSKGAFTPTALVCVNETVSLICRFSLLMWFVPFGGNAEIALTVGARPLKKCHGIIWRDRVRSSW